MLPATDIVRHLQGCSKNAINMSVLRDWIEKVQPKEIGTYVQGEASGCPGKVWHGILGPGSLCFVPPGWMVCERIVNLKETYGIYVGSVFKA